MPAPQESIVICGADLLASHTADYLTRLGCRVTMLVPPGTRDALRTAKELSIDQILEGECRDPDMLQQAGVSDANAVLLLHASDLLNVETALRIREMGCTTRIVSRIFQHHLAQRLDASIPDHTSLSDSMLAAPAFALAATLSSYAGYFYLEDVTQASEPLQLWEVAELELDADHPLVGLSPLSLEQSYATLVVARTGSAPSPSNPAPPPLASIHPGRSAVPTDKFFPAHDPTSPLRAGERIMVLARPDRAQGILHTKGNAASGVFSTRGKRHPESTLPGRRRSWSRALWDWLAQMTPVTKMALAFLSTLLLVGIAVFAAAGITGADVFFFTIVVLTGGYGDLNFLQSPQTAVWVKFVASMLTILGAGMVGLVYGAMTEQVLLSRLGAMLMDRKVPRQGHVVVCGLGNIGMRVVEELHRMRVPVVAIESKADNRFIDTVRRLGVPVIVANAAGAGVLERARVHKAHCLVGATDDDLVNMDVALAARTQFEGLRIVLRVFDQAMVAPLQKMFGVDVTYSVWTLAAPAFAAAALVGKTFGSFRWKDQSVLVQELVVARNSPLAGKLLEDICSHYDLRGFVRGRALDGGTRPASNGIIGVGDRLVLLGTTDAIRRMADIARSEQPRVDDTGH